MVSAVSALGIGPYAPPTRQAIYKLVTPSPENHVSYPPYFQSLAHSFGNEISATLLFSKVSALFSKNTGGGYPRQDLPLLSKDLRTFTPRRLCEGLCPASPFSVRSVRSVVNSCSALLFPAIFCRP